MGWTGPFSWRTSSSALLAVIFSLSFSTGRALSEKEEVKPPNIVLLFADDLGYGDLSSFAHPTIRTPNLDRLGQEGIRLTSFYVAGPSCSPSRASLLTGRYPLRTGMANNIGPDSDHGMNVSEVTMADALHQSGYETMAIGKWHLGHARPQWLPTSRGFDHFFGLPYSHDMIRPWVQTDRPLRFYRDSRQLEGPVDARTITERYTEEALRFIEEASPPFFLYLAHSMPHLPVAASQEFQGKSRAQLYGDVIATLDWSSGRIMEELRKKGYEKNTIIIFTSDNGPWNNLPPRMLQGGVESWHTGSPSLLRGSKGTTYEGGQRVPCVMRWPARIPAGQVSADIVSSLDLYVTLVQAGGGMVPDDRPIDGLDILTFLEGKSPSPRKEFFYFRGFFLEACRVGSWKLRMTLDAREYVRGRTPDGYEPPPNQEVTPELFHLDRDPGERWNVATENPDIVQQLQKRMRDFAARTEGARLTF